MKYKEITKDHIVGVAMTAEMKAWLGRASYEIGSMGAYIRNLIEKDMEEKE